MLCDWHVIEIAVLCMS